ncbi:Alpha/beta hydrolase [Amycolatopsis sacchari]|uniref:Alpha/beta hydrolase n=1 Tax=Amycolatopsis sacchari TaxID=115433 RepID=A0A1I3MFH6_9PSEU|nr:Alpha/beta hydrolase [Amycolatopsis sacchari]
MVTWGEVLRWRPEPLADLVGVLNDRYNRLIGCANDLRATAMPEGWSGPAANAAAAKAARLADSAEELAAEGAMLRRAAGDVSDAITGVLNGVHEAQSLAAAREFRIDEDGVVTGGPPPVCTADDPDGSVAAADNHRVLSELRDRIREVLRSAEDVDDDFCAVLDRIQTSHVIDPGSGRTDLAAAGNSGWALGALSIPPPPNASPADNAAWWATLSPGQRQVLTKEHPELIGPRDGLPTEARDAANRIRLDQTRAELMNQRDDVRHRMDALRHTAGGDIVLTDRAAYERLKEQWDEISGKLNGVDAIYDRLNHPRPGEPRAYLLMLDASGNGKAVIACGNPDTAADVATYVPGTGSELSKISGDINRSDRMVHAAREAGSSSTAVITWQGYEAPGTLVDAARESYVDDGKGKLDSFQEGLRESHVGAPSHNTVIGHSYGTTLVGHAARDGGLNADDLAFVASPGVGADNVSQLHLEGVNQADVGQHVHSTVAAHDMIKVTNVDLAPPLSGQHFDPHGPDPADPGFGGKVFTSDPGTEGPWYEGGLSGAAHSEYWNPNNKALDNLGRIIAGRPTY